MPMSVWFATGSRWLGVASDKRQRPARTGRPQTWLCCLRWLVAELDAGGVVLGNDRGAVRVGQRGGARVTGVYPSRLPAAVGRGAGGRGGPARRYPGGGPRPRVRCA